MRGIFLAVVLTLAATAPCGAAEPIRIGDLNSYTSLPAFSVPYRNGWRLALEQINAAGGVLGRSLQVLSRDDGGMPGDALIAAVREEELGFATRAAIQSIDPLAACATQAPLRRFPQVEPCAVDHVGTVALREATGQGIADLVAARPNRRPITACSSSLRSSSTPFSTTPASRPRQPACSTAAAGVPLVREITIGRQSAVRTAQIRPRSRPTDASASGTMVPGAGASTTRIPWHCRSQPGSAGRFSSPARRRRFSATCSSRSPTLADRFMLA